MLSANRCIRIRVKYSKNIFKQSFIILLSQIISGNIEGFWVMNFVDRYDCSLV
jgi:hypothetical protein